MGSFALSARRTSRRIRTIAIASTVIVCAATATATASTASGGLRSHGVVSTTHASTHGLFAGVPSKDIGYAVNKPLCSTVIRPHHANCFAMKRVPVAKSTTGARPYLKSSVATPAVTEPCPGNALGSGPDGGYDAADLAAAYGYNPAASRSNQTVAIVDWYADPNVKSDLATFDSCYGLSSETASSFRVVNQNGKASPLPSTTQGKDTAGEISLDVETVRAVCNTCKILLIEASNAGDTALGTAEKTAVAMGATEISNSWGEPEKGGVPSSFSNDFNQPGVVITASTGDDGWFDWDFANNPAPTSSSSPPDMSSESPNFPASSPDVVSVGGTTLVIGSGGSITEQTVWNENGFDDYTGLGGDDPDPPAGPEGAGGSGCSIDFSAPAWQKSFPGYSAAGCGGKRLSADVSALADPETGFDVYDTWGSGDDGWVTVGGTSLASPIVAAMYALAGGSGGAAYPAQSIYENDTLHPADFDDIVASTTPLDLPSGNSFCGGDDTADCGTFVENNFGGTHNPNALGGGNVDCSFPRDTSDPASPPALSSECNAVAGYDGPTGVGTPLTASALASTSPSVSISHPSSLALHHAAKFTVHYAPRISGTSLSNVYVNYGDGAHTSSKSLTPSHTYTKKGQYVVVAIVTDSLGQQSVTYTVVTVGKAIGLKLFGPKTAKAKHKAKFHVTTSDPNTGGKVKSVSWKWGDGHKSKGTRVSHTWRKKGHYKITITVTDNTGVKTTYVAHQKVKK